MPLGRERSWNVSGESGVLLVEKSKTVFRQEFPVKTDFLRFEQKNTKTKG
jgi:hypothetical protein